MEDKQLFGQNQQYNPNQAYNQNQAYTPSQTAAQNPAYNQSLPNGKNQTCNPNPAYNANQAYSPNPGYCQNQAYTPSQTYDQNQMYYQGQPYPPQPVKAVVYDTMPMKHNNAAIAGLILGIFALLGCWLPVWNLLLSIVGIVCSAIGSSPKGPNSSISIAGLIISVIALLLAIVFTIVYWVALTL